MSNRLSALIASTLVLAPLPVLSCSAASFEQSPDNDSEQVGSVSHEQGFRRSRRPAASPNPSSSGSTQTRQTSDGETIRVFVPEPAPTVEVPAGGTCGVVNSEGVLLSCQPGTYCLSPAEGVPGTCQPAPRAPRSEG
jgi:hypothetical protein